MDVPHPAADWHALLRQPDVAALIELALREDVGGGDVTTQAIFKAPQRAVGHVLARHAVVACGVPLASELLRRLDPEAAVDGGAADGAVVAGGAKLFDFVADVRAVLTVERTLLNFLMRLCGIATAAAAAVAAIPEGSATKVYDTRKTVPGWRSLDKWAVRAGGACNHRMGLYDAVLIKDNHVAAAGSVRAAVQRARQHVGHRMVVEVEIDTLAQLDEAVEAQPDVILLDNFDPAALRTAVARVAGAVILEVSGGITQAQVAQVCATGVQRISMGALTHSVLPADLSLEIVA